MSNDIYTEARPTPMSQTGTGTRPRSASYCNRPLPPLPLPNSQTPFKRRHTCHMPPSKRTLSHFPTLPPALFPQEQVEVLSLQDYTFLYILSHVDDYPVQLLSMLPKIWRKMLLSTLPPFRLCVLEKTAIANDIDTEEIWMKLSHLKDSIWGDYSIDTNNANKTHTFQNKQITVSTPNTSSPCESLRIRFINYLSYLLFNEMNRDYACKRITELLHAIHVDMLDQTVANGLIGGHVNSLFMFQTPYYFIPFRCPNLTEREIYWSLFGNKMIPTALEVYLYNLDSSPLWNQEVISQELMRRLLSQLQFLRLYNRTNKMYQLEEVINAVTHSSKYKEPPSSMGNLKHLEVLRTDDQHLATIAPYFSAPNGYSNLTTLVIAMRPIRYIQVSQHICSIVKHQLNSLQHLELQGFTCYISRNIIQCNDYMLYNALATLILKPHFRTLVLDHIKDLPWKLLQILIEAVLRTVPSREKKLCLRNSQVTVRGVSPFRYDESDEEDDDDNEENQFYPASETKCLQHKKILFQKSSLPVELFNWFEKVDRLSLNTLEFDQVKVDAFKYISIIEYSQGVNGVDYGTRVSKRIQTTGESDLKQKFRQHENFDCRFFVWKDVKIDDACLMNV